MSNKENDITSKNPKEQHIIQTRLLYIVEPEISVHVIHGLWGVGFVWGSVKGLGVGSVGWRWCGVGERGVSRISLSWCLNRGSTTDFMSCSRGFLITISINKKSMGLWDIFSPQEHPLSFSLLFFFFFSKNIMQSLVPKTPGGILCLFFVSFVLFRRKKKLKALKFFSHNYS